MSSYAYNTARPRTSRTSRTYRTQGNVAYAPAYGYAPGTQERPVPKSKRRSRVRSLTRTAVRVRQPGQIAPMTVLGMLAVAFLSALLLMGYAQYTGLSDQTVRLRNELSQLESENATLSAQYEQVFDISRIEAYVGDQMQRPVSGQIEYIDLSKPDSVEICQPRAAGFSVERLRRGVSSVWSELLAYLP